MTRRVFVCVVLAVLSIAASSLADDQHPNVKRGFAVDAVYELGELDQVNAFNGNLVIQVPIGPRIHVGGQLSYGITLTYNSKVWDYEPSISGNLQLNQPVNVLPTRGSNAGLGWLLSFGRILYENSPANGSRVLAYESPDGSEHAIYCTLHEDEFPDIPCGIAVNGGHVQGYTRDGTYLRMRMITDTRAAIDFPDGTTHFFDDDVAHREFRFSRMEDRFGNFVAVTYSTDGKTWTISDSGSSSRISVVRFEDTPALPTGFTRPRNYDTRVKQIEVPQWNTATRTGYVLTYDDSPTVRRGCLAEPFVYVDNVEPRPPELRQITHGQTLAAYKFQYLNSAEHSSPSDKCGTGSLKSMEIPTGALYEYTYRSYTLPTAGCTIDASINETGGVSTRVISDVARGKASHQYKWTYVPSLTGSGTDWGCTTNVFQKSYEEAKTVISASEVSESGTRNVRTTTNYFSIWAKDGESSNHFKKEEYGLPLTHSASDDGKFLSTVVSNSGDSGADIMTYVKYEVDPKSRFDAFPPAAWNRNRRVQSTRVKYEKDGKYADTTYDTASFDGLGHYRKMTTGGNFDGSNVRVTNTNYNPGTALPSKPFPTSQSFYIPTIAHDAEWILGAFDSVTVTEGSSTANTEYCFDLTKTASHKPTGFMTGRRTRGDSSKPTNDLLALFEPDGDGNLAHEKYYGGDKTPTSSSGCSAGTAAAQFDVTHSWLYGTLQSSQYSGSGFLTVDNSDIDKYSGLVSATRDSIGLITKYQYDSLGRLTNIDPQSAGPHFKYTYSRFNGGTTSPTVDVQALATASSSTSIDRKVVRYDSLGRVWYEFDQLPGTAQRATLDNWSVRSVEYDADSHPTRSFEREQLSVATKDPSSQRPTLSNRTTIDYDYVGRPLVITAPDKHVIRYTYSGNSKVDEVTQRVSADGSERDSTVTRISDRFGRLHEVREFSGDTDESRTHGSEVKTQYTWDVGDRLVNVSMDGGKQVRTFEYDRRGLLHKEHHPENGDTVFEDYDARGNSGKRTNGGKVTKFDYDKAERIEAVTDSSDNPLKSYKFGGENDGNARGKLLTATRRNDLVAGRVDVTERYEYDGAAGQVSKRTTSVERVQASSRTELQSFAYSMTYDALLLPRDVTMPCSLPGCTVPTGGLPKVTNERTAGYLTGVTGFASLTYNASGMVENVIHTTPGTPTDKYATRDGIARPSQITFSPCGGGAPTFLPGPILVKANALTCGLQVTWPLATVCNGVSSVRYRVLRDGDDVTERSGQSCLTDHTFIDRTAQPGTTYSYTIVAEGPAVSGGTGKCQSGIETRSATVSGSFTSCDTDATLTVPAVLAYVGIPATYTAKLVGANGPIRDEPLVFSVNGQVIGQARTGPDGSASVIQALDITPKLYEGGIKVTYTGTLLPAKSTVANLNMVCGFASYTVRPVALNVRTDAGSYGVFVSTSDRCSWMTESLADFITVRPPGPRTGIGSFNLDVTKNPTTKLRSGTVNVALQTVSVRQSGPDCSFRFSPEIAYVPADSRGLLRMDVSTSAGCHWDVTIDNASRSWFHFAPPPFNPNGPPITGGTGPDTLFFTVDRQTVAEKRSATLTIAGDDNQRETGHVNQDAPLPGICPSDLVLDLEGGSVSNGQNVPLRVHVNVGTELEYHWYIDDRPAYPFCANCPAVVFHPGDSEYPAPGQSKTYMVEIRNNNQLCEGVVSNRVTWTNNTPANSNCHVPIISSSLLYGDAPGDAQSPNPGYPLRIYVVGQHNAGGTGDVTYQWYAGASGDRTTKVPHSADLPPDTVEVSPHRTSFYWCEVTDTCGATGNPQSNQSRTGAVYVTAGPQSRRRAVSHDFTGDHRSDIAWHNPTTQQNEIWSMTGTAHTGTTALPASRPGMEMQSTGDINADGNTDIIWRDPATGKNEVWLMRRTQLDDVVTLPTRSGDKWTIGAVADYDGDDHDDIVWHNSATGENEMIFHSETEQIGAWALPSSGGNTGIYGTADFNNDEKPDLFLHNRATGENQIWLMNDGTRSTIASASNGGSAAPTRHMQVSSRKIASMSDTDFTPTLVADMNGDGKPDVVWRNAASGENRVWLMDGTNVVDTVSVEPRTDTTWQMGGGGMGSSSDTTPTGDGGSGTGGQTVSSLALTVDATSIGKPAPATATLTSNGAPVADRELVFSVSGTEITRLLTDASGSATAVVETTDRPAGRYTGAVSVQFAGDGTYKSSSAAADLVIASQTPVVTWSDPAPMMYGEPLSNAQLNATATAAGTFVYTPPLGAVPEAGYQTLSVTFTPADTTLAPIAKLAVVYVNKALSSVAWPKPSAIAYGVPLGAAQLNASSSMSGTFTYVPDAGTLLPVGATQPLGVTFEPSDPNFEKSSATTTIDVGKGSQYVMWDAPSPITVLDALGGSQLNARVIASGTAAAGQLTYNPPAGTLLTPGVHALRVTAAATNEYEAAAASVDVVVRRVVPLLQWQPPAPIVYGTALSPAQLSATADVPGVFMYAQDAGTILDAGSNELFAVFIPTDPRYDSANIAVTLEVLKAQQTISWAPPAPIVYGTTLGSAQLSATATASGPAPAGTLTYLPPFGTLLQAGAAQTLTVRAEETGNYQSATASVTVDVRKANPVITWPAPAAIVYGTPLGAAQLNATADVAGTFTYTPASGTILDAGAAQTLSAHFTPSDLHNYESADATRTLDVAKAKQTLSWSAPAGIVYGTALSSLQLNATVQVVGPSAAGALSYAPASGTVLDAGAARTLTVTAAETRNYDVATKSVTIDVARAPLSLRVDAKSKIYGAEMPALTGTLTGVVNADPLTPAYATSATRQSGAGVYPITGSIVDPAHRLSNYDVTITPATITILTAPLQIAANPASKQYSDPVPTLTATFTGFVLGETPAVLSGTLSIVTTGVATSAPGSYPISIGGLSSPNYTITYVGSTMTVTAEDARVVITSPELVSAEQSGPTSVLLSATVQDISATADAAGDDSEGDIRKATLTFVDPSTGAALCTAPIGLVRPADTRTGVVTCSFTRDFGTTLPAGIPVGAIVAGYYTRNAAADDQALTVAKAVLGDQVDGGGKFVAATSAGAYAPNAGTEAQYEIHFRNDSKGAVSGSIRVTFDRTDGGATHKYELTPVSISSLALKRTNPGGTVMLVGSGTLVDSTTRQTVVAAAPFIVTATDTGNGGEHGSLSVTLLKPDGGVWVAAGWSGVRTVEQPVQNGNVQIGYGK